LAFLFFLALLRQRLSLDLAVEESESNLESSEEEVLSSEFVDDSESEVCFFCLLLFFFRLRRSLREDFFFLSSGLALVMGLEPLLLALFELEESSPPSGGPVWGFARLGRGISRLSRSATEIGGPDT
jgi:hypothetical protein